MPTAWLSPGITRGFESKLVEESLFGLSKRTNVDDSTLCSCQQVTHLATSIPVKLAASSSPLQRELISWSIFIVSKKKTIGTLRDRHCTRPPCSIRSSPSGSSTSCSFPSGSCATRHQGYAFSKRPSSCRRGSARSTHASICCHRDHSSRRRSIYHDSHTCPKKCSSCHARNLFGCSCLRDGPGGNTPVPQSLCSVAGPGHDAPTHRLPFFLSHRMPEVAPIAVGTHLVVGDPPTQSLSQLLVPRTTMFGSFGGGSQHSLQRPRLRVLLHFHLIEKTVKHNLWLDPLIQFLLSTRLNSQARFLAALYAVRTEATAISIKCFVPGEFTRGSDMLCPVSPLDSNFESTCCSSSVPTTEP